MPELFDIVDRDDNVIGQSTYDDARADNKIIRVVHNWIINSDGNILFQFRAAHKKNRPRHFDASVGGRVNAGETYDVAVKRETCEELGLNITPIYLGKVLADDASHHKFVSVYYTKHDGPFTGWENEAECLEWMGIDEASYLMKRYPYLFCQTPSFGLLYNYLGKNK